MSFRRLFFWSLLLFAVSCARHPNDALCTGDLLFIENPDYPDETSMDGAIEAATGSFIHVAIVDVDADGQVWVIDATRRRGVDRHSLDTLLSDFSTEDGRKPVLTVKRLKDTTGVHRYVQNALSFIGQSYDETFLPDNGAMYCSELVRESYRMEDGTYLFEDQPMNFRNAQGAFPPFWQDHFARLGLPIPQDTPGTNPTDLAASPLLINRK